MKFSVALYAIITLCHFHQNYAMHEPIEEKQSPTPEQALIKIQRILERTAYSIDPTEKHNFLEDVIKLTKGAQIKFARPLDELYDQLGAIYHRRDAQKMESCDEELREQLTREKRSSKAAVVARFKAENRYLSAKEIEGQCFVHIKLSEIYKTYKCSKRKSQKNFLVTHPM